MLENWPYRMYCTSKLDNVSRGANHKQTDILIYTHNHTYACMFSYIQCSNNSNFNESYGDRLHKWDMGLEMIINTLKEEINNLTEDKSNDWRVKIYDKLCKKEEKYKCGDYENVP